MTDTTPAAVAQIISDLTNIGYILMRDRCEIAETLRGVAAERDALAAALVVMGINPAGVIAAVKKDKADG